MDQRATVRVWLTLVALTLLVGCAITQQDGTQTTVEPRTVQETLYLADTNYQAFVRTATDLAAEGYFSLPTMERINDLVQKGDEVLDGAWAAYEAGNRDTIAADISTVKNITQALREIVVEARKERGPGEGLL